MPGSTSTHPGPRKSATQVLDTARPPAELADRARRAEERELGRLAGFGIVGPVGAPAHPEGTARDAALHAPHGSRASAIAIVRISDELHPQGHLAPSRRRCLLDYWPNTASR